MTRSPARSHARVREYWSWVAVALFLLVSLDLLLTLYAAATVGVEAESNPIMQWLLRQSTLVLIGSHLLVVVTAVALFDLLLALIAHAAPRYERVLIPAVEIWLGLLVAAGLFVFANNLSVIVYGQSLL